MLRSRSALTLCALLLLSATLAHPAQDQPNKQNSEGKTAFLVARPDLREPIFKESVILRLPSSVGVGEGLVVGLILNKPALVALSDIFPDDGALENRSETVYFGGPVEPRAPGVVFRSSKAVTQATLLFGDIYVSFDPDFIRELLKEPEKTPDLRLFVGRSQWAPAQLQNEMAMGAWYNVRAETSLIFSATTQYLWRKLLDRAEPAPVAQVARPALSASQCPVPVGTGPQRLIPSGAGGKLSQFEIGGDKRIYRHLSGRSGDSPKSEP